MPGSNVRGSTVFFRIAEKKGGRGVPKLNGSQFFPYVSYTKFFTIFSCIFEALASRHRRLHIILLKSIDLCLIGKAE